MARSRTLTTAAAVALAGGLVVTLGPSGGTEAQWRDTASSQVTGPSSDTFAMTATNVPDGVTPTWPGAAWKSSASVNLTNRSARHSSWIDVKSTRVTKVVGGDSNTILNQTALDYTIGTGACGTGSQSSYWQARGQGTITDGTTYTRPSTKVAGATLAPQGSQTLCPQVRHGYNTDTTAGQRSLLLNHAGRALDITTVVGQRSEAPATWASPEQTVTSRYRLAMPSPVTPATSDVCRTTYPSGAPSGSGYYGGFFWGWPDAPTDSYVNPVATPAMAGGWDIMRQTSNGGWEVWDSVASGSERSIAGLYAGDIDPNLDVIRRFKLRGYPFAGDKSRYVESAWIARAERASFYYWFQRYQRWQCHTPLQNPDAGPHNMP